MKTPVTKQSLKTHFTYSWWRYALLVVLAVFGVNFIFSTTRYQSPAEKRVEIYSVIAGDQEKLDAYMASVREAEMPDMEVMSSVFLTHDSAYVATQLMIYIAAAEGDIYILPRDNFIALSEQGGFSPLEDSEAIMAACGGLDLEKGWRMDKDSGENHLFGIPAAQLPGMENYFLNPENAFVALLYSNGNQENCEKFLARFIRDMKAEPAAE